MTFTIHNLLSPWTLYNMYKGYFEFYRSLLSECVCFLIHNLNKTKNIKTR